MSLVFDTSALIAQAKREPGAATVDVLLADPQPRLVHAVNLCEVYYYFLKRGVERQGEQALRDLEQVGLERRDDIDPSFWRAVARFKADLPHASLGDCFVIALARRVGGTIVTADHPGFDPAAARSICAVTFIR